MNPRFTTPQEAEDAYYDAIDEQDIEALMSVWEASDEVLCLLPMMPAQRGRSAIRNAWSGLLQAGTPLDIEVIHLSWIETPEIAIHLLEERVRVPQQAEAQGIYASNVYRKGDQGWQLLMHQNSPTPPPPGFQMPEAG
ncbi:MAG: nuclear transport factor 2 family protein [Candidatus Thiodiazotropha sp.]